MMIVDVVEEDDMLLREQCDEKRINESTASRKQLYVHIFIIDV